MNKESFINKIKNVFDKYDNNNNNNEIDLILVNVKDDLQLCFSNYINEHIVYETDFPIEFNNNFGHWRIEANGDSFLIPRKVLSKLECKILILSSKTIL